MEKETLKADLHVHSRHSNEPDQWLLRAAGCGESYSDPLRIYRTARERGMDMVTITDHNSLAGSLAIAHLENTFVSEEITAFFPEDKCKIHVLAYDLTEKHHEDITRARENVYDLVEYLHGENIVHALAHPLYSVNEMLTPDHFEKLLALFKIFEINGTRDSYQNNTLRSILESLTPEKMDELSNRHGIALRGKAPWKKGFTAGSDDHSGFNIAGTHTIFECEDRMGRKDFTPGDLLSWLWERKGIVSAKASSPQTLAHNIYSIGCQFYKDRTGGLGDNPGGLFSSFMKRVLIPGSLSPMKEKGQAPSDADRSDADRSDADRSEMAKEDRDAFVQASEQLIGSDDSFKKLLADPNVEPSVKTEAWGRFLENGSEQMLKDELEGAFERIAEADIFGMFQHLGRLASVYTLLVPYFTAFSVFTRDRKLCRDCFCHLQVGTGSQKHEPVRVAHFTDTLFDINGVAGTIRKQREMAEKFNLPWAAVTCGERQTSSHLAVFEPVAEYPLPAYSQLKLFMPPLLKMLKYCYEENFTMIHSATPGPVGLAALAISKILKLPIVGTYHTALPQYASDLTGDHELENAMWKFVLWYYNQMDIVYAPSKATGRELTDRGLKPEKIRFYQRGIDIERFTPSKRNGFFKRKFDFDEPRLKLIYVGRVSREKNLPWLVDIFKNVCAQRDDLTLVVVGDGPYLDEMKQELAGFPALFTGVLRGDDLAEAFASSDIFVFPSTTDTFGNVVLEAQASGLPVVLTDQGGPKENLVAGKTGFVVPADQPERFAQILLNLVNNPPLIRKMGDEARTYMQNRGFEGAFLKQWNNYSRIARSLSNN